MNVSSLIDRETFEASKEFYQTLFKKKSTISKVAAPPPVQPGSPKSLANLNSKSQFNKVNQMMVNNQGNNIEMHFNQMTQNNNFNNQMNQMKMGGGMNYNMNYNKNIIYPNDNFKFMPSNNYGQMINKNNNYNQNNNFNHFNTDYNHMPINMHPHGNNFNNQYTMMNMNNINFNDGYSNLSGHFIMKGEDERKEDK